MDRKSVVEAYVYGPVCYQFIPGFDATYSLNENSYGCLFLNAQAPTDRTGSLTVLVMIHGGGYAIRDDRVGYAPIMNANNNSFIVVSI